MQTVKCDVCNESYEIADWPFCPHGKPHYHVDAFEPYWDHNLTPDGVSISSARQRRRIMDENGLVYHKNEFAGSVGDSRRRYFDRKTNAKV